MNMQPVIRQAKSADKLSSSTARIAAPHRHTIGVLAMGIAFLTGTPVALAESGLLTTLHSFTGTDGSYPQAGLIVGSDGYFYGTTENGGVSGDGNAYKITSSGSLTSLYSFSGSDGASPTAGLIQSSNGNFYGTTNKGGTSNTGTVFMLTSTGSEATVYSFGALGGIQGIYPDAGLIQGTDGNLYGTTTAGGSGNYGTVFKITTSGALTTLHSFSTVGFINDGSTPNAGLVQGTDGNFYGTTTDGGASGFGVVFKITPAGAITTLYSFGGSDGEYPYSGLVQGTDGNFYGTTTHGGAQNQGVVFKITPTGALTILHSFSGGTEGQFPSAGLIRASNGNFYGTTVNGGASGYGTLFTITPSGTLTTLYAFTASDGRYPYAGLVQDSSGYFYGTTVSGGTGSNGTVFKLQTLPGPPAPTNLTVSVRKKKITLSWTASPGATSYNLYQGTSAGGESTTPVQTGITGTSTGVTGARGTTYYFRVAAVNSEGTSPLSNEASTSSK